MRRIAIQVFVLACAIGWVSNVVQGQCPTGAREFASRGSVAAGLVDQVSIDTNGSENAGNEIGRFWQSDNSLFGNNFEGGCESNDPGGTFGEWWFQRPNPERRYIRGAIGATNCGANTCPQGDLTVVVEDPGPDGLDAYFIGFRVDGNIPGTYSRYWDLSRVDPDPTPSLLLMHRFPVPQVFSMDAQGTTIELDLLLADVADNVHAVNGVEETPLPASSIVKSYDLYRADGDDPGREVGAWTLVGSEPYLDGPAQRPFTLDCPLDGSPFRIALGVTFEGGAGPGVTSALVGRSVEVDCDQAVAMAGADRIVECSDKDGTDVALDGSGSLNAWTYLWEAPGVVFDDPGSSQPVGSFPLGTTVVSLTVSDGMEQDIDTVEVTVVDSTPPEVVCAVSFGGSDEDSDDEESDEVMQIALDASDGCAAPTVEAIVDLGFAFVPAEDGMPLDLSCVPDGSCSLAGGCGDLVSIQTDTAVLQATATDCGGNTATCSLDLCWSEGGSPDEAQAPSSPGGDGSMRLDAVSRGRSR